MNVFMENTCVHVRYRTCYFKPWGKIIANRGRAKYLDIRGLFLCSERGTLVFPNPRSLLCSSGTIASSSSVRPLCFVKPVTSELISQNFFHTFPLGVVPDDVRAYFISFTLLLIFGNG